MSCLILHHDYLTRNCNRWLRVNHQALYQDLKWPWVTKSPNQLMALAYIEKVDSGTTKEKTVGLGDI